MLWEQKSPSLVEGGLQPEDRKGRCSIVDLLDPHEWDRPSCGDINCRCSLRSHAIHHDMINYFHQH